jgi:hypothetical protein
MSADLMPQFNDILRDGVIGVVDGLTAELPGGGVLGLIIGLLWPESDHSQETWNSIKKYAEELVAGAIDEARVNVQSDRLSGFKKVAESYRDTSMSQAQKGQRLTSLLSDLELFEPDFWNSQNPEKMFPLFTTFGTLWIFALTEQAFFYDKVYHEVDADAAKHLALLRREIKKYTDAAQAMFDRLLAWRFGLLEVQEYQWLSATQSESEWTLVDRYGKGFTVSSGRGGDWGYRFHNPAGQAQIELIAANRVAEINGDFVENLQALLGVAQMWQYADPTVPRPLSRWVVTSQGPVGGIAGTVFEDRPPKDTSRITRIRIRYAQVVDYLELFHDGVSAGGHGNPQGGTQYDLDLAEDEWVVGMSGRTGLFVDALAFTTNKGRTVGGGGNGGQPFSARGNDSWTETRLFSLGGRSDSRRLTALHPTWQHRSSLQPYVASYKRNGQPIPALRDIRLRAKDGTFVGDLVEEYSGRAAANEYFPKVRPGGVGIQLRPRETGATPAGFADRSEVSLRTSETKANGYDALAKYTSANLYYYTYSAGDLRQLWMILKTIPSDGPVLFGESFYLRNMEECAYMYPTDDGYLGIRLEPYAWEAVPLG